ncbi:hypothetical protein ACQ4M4_11425 [Leptolyngbya sp. AN02str]|uniref:hypothetical protein n=1 Tax=Leptolyngbya sp. AN02str TaxID=3423363 RepID=UPI003D314D47
MAASSQTPSTQESPLYTVLAAAVHEGRLDDLVCHLIPLLNQNQLARVEEVIEKQSSRLVIPPGQIKLSLKKGRYLYIRRTVDGGRQEKFLGAVPLDLGKVYRSSIGVVQTLGYTIDGGGDWKLACDGILSPVVRLAVIRDGYVASIEKVAMNDIDDDYQELEPTSSLSKSKGIIVPTSLTKRVQASLSSIECILKSAGASVVFEGEIGSDLYRILCTDAPISFLEVGKQDDGLSLNCDIHPSQFIELVRVSAECIQQAQEPEWLLPVAKYFASRSAAITTPNIRGVYELLST